MGKIQRHIGGPGTGKTKLILDSLTQAKNELGLSTDEIALCTFTRAGRQELSERAAGEWGCEPEALTRHGWFRTAHSLAHRQCEIEEGQLIEGADGAAWIGEAVGGKVQSKFDARSREVSYVSGDGDIGLTLALRGWDLARSRLVPLAVVWEEWARAGNTVPDASLAKTYIERYEAAKRMQGRIDYTDLVAKFAGILFTADGPVEVDPEGEVPAGVRVLAIDEAQDSSVLVDRICRRLAASDSVERVFISGDPYQSIYSFGGGDFRLFLDWDAEEHIMPQSYRCPPVIMSLGERCIQRMRRGYKSRGILPASHDGRVCRAASADEAVSQISPDESVLILGRCGFSLEQYEEVLRKRSIPYAWIDKVGSAAEMSGYACLWDLQHGQYVSHDQWQSAIAMLSVSHKTHGQLLVRGEKEAWKKGLRADVDYFRSTDEEFALAGATEKLADLVRAGAWHECLDKSHASKGERWLDCAKRYGPELACNPKVKLSTIHGAKGCEGDRVILSTISSPAIERGRACLSDLHDEECRVSYVAVTRARRELWIVSDADRYQMEIPA